MKKSVLLLGAMLSVGAMAQNYNIISSADELIEVNHQLNAPMATGALYMTTLIESEEYVDFGKTYTILSMNEGAPSMPYFTESVLLPGEGNVTLEVTYDSYTEYDNVQIAPSKGSLKRNVQPSEVSYTFGAEYSTDAFYPGNLAEITDPFILRNTRGVTIKTNPFQYNPVTKVLRVYNNIRSSVIINPEEVGINELSLLPETSSIYANIYENFYLNSAAYPFKYTPVEEEGSMLIITDNNYEDEMASFVEWKNQSGIKTEMVNTGVTGTTDTEIKDYIEDYYSSNPDLLFVLLVGDHNKIPAHTYGWAGSEQLWSDSYYGQMTGDYYPELFVGRFSGVSTSIETQVERTLEYEKNPAAGNWMAKAIGLASNEGAGYGDDGEADWQHARNIRAKLLAFGYDEVFEFYDGSQGGADASGNPNAAMISPEVNSGIGLFNYTGHGAEDVCVTGNFHSDDINGATNNGKYPFVVSVACNNGSFTSGTCISEVWLRATNSGSPSGAIAASGSTILMAWAEPMQVQDEMAELISESYATNRKSTIGGLFFNSMISMLEDYSSSGTAIEVMQTWVLFGDPSTLFRTQETQDMVVSHSSHEDLGLTSLDVACDVDDVNIAVSQDGVLLGEGLSSGGSVTITFDAISSTSPLIVIGTKQNYKPYDGVVWIAGNVGLDEEKIELNVFPNPADDIVNINWNESSSATITLRDLSGKVVYNEVSNGTNTTLNTSEYASGIYMLDVNINGVSSITKLVIR